jgi:uncharacterized protein involved in exopolysaccharide biosynthesis
MGMAPQNGQHPLEISTHLTPREVALVLFRHRRIIVGSFAAISAAALAFVLLRTPVYSAQLKILVNRERVDPIVGADQSTTQQVIAAVSDEDVNSELQLLTSQDLLKQVVTSCNLHNRKSWWGAARARIHNALGLKSARDEKMAIAEAVISLRRKTVAQVLPKSTMIEVTYASPDPELSAQVLNTLAELYQQKHLAVRRPQGAFDFFHDEAEHYFKGLVASEVSLAQFGQEHHISSVQTEKEAVLRKITDLELTVHDTEASIEVAQRHLQTVEMQLAATPARVTTEMHKSSGKSSDQLRDTLLNLEIKRVELLDQFQPDYPPLQELEKQIAQARAAVAASEEASLTEETTDRDSTYDWLRSELIKAKLELVDLQARRAATSRILIAYRAKAPQLDQMDMAQQDLLRNAKLTEANYLLYARKREEARISDALDRQHIVNVAIAEKAAPPLMPSGLPSSLVLAIGCSLGMLVGVGLAFAREQWDTSFRTPQEVEAFLKIPVVTSVPRHGAGNGIKLGVNSIPN